jgi:DNA-binding response OmpR family regulator
VSTALSSLDQEAPRNCVLVAAPITRSTHDLVRYLVGMDTVPLVAASATHLRYLAEVARVDLAVVTADLAAADPGIARAVAGLDVPVVLLGDRAVLGIDDPARVLSSDADDFEVALEVRRQMRSVQGGRIRFGALELDIRHHAATWYGQDLDLTPTQFRILGVLVRAAGGVVSRPELARRAMGTYGPGDEARLEAHLRRLRSKIEGMSSAPMLVTVRGEGIRLSDVPD